MFRLQEPWDWLCTPTAQEILEILEILGSKWCSQCRSFRFREESAPQQTVACPVGPGRNEAIPNLQYWWWAANFRIGFWHSSFDLLRFILSQVFNLRRTAQHPEMRSTKVQSHLHLLVVWVGSLVLHMWEILWWRNLQCLRLQTARPGFHGEVVK